MYGGYWKRHQGKHLEFTIDFFKLESWKNKGKKLKFKKKLT
jgi:hypothetical protein